MTLLPTETHRKNCPCTACDFARLERPKRESYRTPRGPQDQTRELEICALYSGGETMLEIGDHFGISRERIRQILARNGLGGVGHFTRVDPIKVLAAVRASRSLREAAVGLGMGTNAVSRVVRALAPSLLDELRAYHHEEARQRWIRRIRETAKRLGRPPTVHEVSPGGSVMRELFGSASAALAHAGYQSKRNCHPHLTADQIEEIARRYTTVPRGRRVFSNAAELATEFGITPNRVYQIGAGGKRRTLAGWVAA